MQADLLVEPRARARALSQGLQRHTDRRFHANPRFQRITSPPPAPPLHLDGPRTPPLPLWGRRWDHPQLALSHPNLPNGAPDACALGASQHSQKAPRRGRSNARVPVSQVRGPGLLTPRPALHGLPALDYVSQSHRFRNTAPLPSAREICGPRVGKGRFRGGVRLRAAGLASSLSGWEPGARSWSLAELHVCGSERARSARAEMFGGSVAGTADWVSLRLVLNS
ncbi:uncharacterized protein LOC105877019 [Microcebus murinus]|uniref:uncharacterized protein LOC105877019 n=1 Tax=Microcebus murinus TaxID=30608 RepID=UPI003F6A9FEC